MTMLPLKFLTIHCAATPEGRDISADTVAGWDKAKFGQESYHHIVTLDGVDHLRLRDEQEGAHVHLHNSGNIGVCYIGGTDLHGIAKDTRTPAQKMTLRAIVSEYRKKFPWIIVRGHRDWSADANHDGKIEPYEWLKSCPSFDVGTEL
jgi:N-acetylmuramoyl-L-alanine amidase